MQVDFQRFMSIVLALKCRHRWRDYQTRRAKIYAHRNAVLTPFLQQARTARVDVSLEISCRKKLGQTLRCDHNRLHRDNHAHRPFKSTGEHTCPLKQLDVKYERLEINELGDLARINKAYRAL